MHREYIEDARHSYLRENRVARPYLAPNCPVEVDVSDLKPGWSRVHA